MNINAPKSPIMSVILLILSFSGYFRLYLKLLKINAIMKTITTTKRVLSITLFSQLTIKS